eukprot:1120283_1
MLLVELNHYIMIRNQKVQNERRDILSLLFGYLTTYVMMFVGGTITALIIISTFRLLNQILSTVDPSHPTSNDLTESRRYFFPNPQFESYQIRSDRRSINNMN